MLVYSGAFEFTYTGAYTVEGSLDGNFIIRFQTSGTLTIKDHGGTGGSYDLFAVGGGGGGTDKKNTASPQNTQGYGGGGGGRTATSKNIRLASGRGIPITVGAGGSPNNNGGSSSFASVLPASGGSSGNLQEFYTQTVGDKAYFFVGGNGGSGGGTGATESTNFGYLSGFNFNGGSNGNNGIGVHAHWSGADNIPGGTGQGTTTREFGDASGKLYAGGGGGSYYTLEDDSEISMSSVGRGANGGGNGTYYSYLYAQSKTRVATSARQNTGSGGGAGLAYFANMTEEWRQKVNAGSGGSGIVCLRNAR